MELNDLKKRRAIIKSQLTRFNKYLGEITAGINDVTICNINMRLSKIKHLYDQFKEIRLQIESLDIENEENNIERELVESHYFDLVSPARDLVSKNTNTDFSTSIKQNRVLSHKP